MEKTQTSTTVISKYILKLIYVIIIFFNWIETEIKFESSALSLTGSGSEESLSLSGSAESLSLTGLVLQNISLSLFTLTKST